MRRRQQHTRAAGAGDLEGRFETVNIAWPRESLAPLDAPFYQVWAAPLLLALIAAIGGAYLLLAKPQRTLPGPANRGNSLWR